MTTSPTDDDVPYPSTIVDLTNYTIADLHTADIPEALATAITNARQAQSYAAHGSSPVVKGTP